MFDDVASVTLSTALSALSERQRVSANNIANMGTANFTASQVSFEASLANAVAAGDPSQAQTAVTPTTDPAGVNGNNVNLNTETLTDEKTQLQYSLLSGAMSAKFALLDTVIKG